MGGTRRRQPFSVAIGRLVARRWHGLPDETLGGFDAPGFTIAATSEGRVKVSIGCDSGEQIGFQMEGPVARSFFERGVAVVNAAEVGERRQ